MTIAHGDCFIGNTMVIDNVGLNGIINLGVMALVNIASSLSICLVGRCDVNS